MADALAQLANEVVEMARRKVGDPARIGQFWAATWTAVEASDADLSQITLQGGQVVRWVPHLEAASWPPTAGDVVLVVKVASSMLILGRIKGDRTATV